MNSICNGNIRVRLSTLWAVVVLNMILVEIFNILMIVYGQAARSCPVDADSFILVKIIFCNIAVLMILLSRVLPRNAARISNLVAVFPTFGYLLYSSDWTPHWIVILFIELILLGTIFLKALFWRVKK